MNAANYKALNKLTIQEKIYFKGKAYLFLRWTQYEQLVSLNKLILAPYYFDLLRLQGREVAEAENFKSIYGKSRFEYENNI
jgi:hypothetical protein